MKPITFGLTLLTITSSILIYKTYFQDKKSSNKSFDSAIKEVTPPQPNQIKVAGSPFQKNDINYQAKEKKPLKTINDKITVLSSQSLLFKSNEAFDQAMQNMFENSSESESTEHYRDLISRQPEYIDGNISQENIVCSEISCMLSVYFVDETSLERFMQSFTSSSNHPIISHTLVPIEGRANLVFDISEN
ncbi:hypothetical protein [Aliikangiella sp. IMCC44359]|uniref:hypothetical protein n=1 Tax=Aliikangiella sp. IMCC44359 TaxID=3459125 RepID=UPI00403B0E01